MESEVRLYLYRIPPPLPPHSLYCRFIVLTIFPSVILHFYSRSNIILAMAPSEKSPFTYKCNVLQYTDDIQLDDLDMTPITSISGTTTSYTSETPRRNIMDITWNSNIRRRLFSEDSVDSKYLIHILNIISIVIVILFHLKTYSTKKSLSIISGDVEYLEYLLSCQY